MRRILPIAVSCFLIAFPLLARGGGGHGGGGGHAGGGHVGGGGMRGGGGFRGAGAFRGAGFRGAGFRNGAFRGNQGFRGFRGRYGYGFYGGLWGYPWLYGGLYDDCFWDYDDCYGYPDNGYGYMDNGAYYPPYGPSYAPSYSEPAPGVVIISNQTPPLQGFAPPPPVPSVWNAPPATTQAKKYEEPLYLLAMNDGTIRAVLAYWVDGQTVHYVTMDHMQKTTPLGSLNRSLSERLNRERNVTFNLPG
jgi:hypothetical protein